MATTAIATTQARYQELGQYLNKRRAEFMKEIPVMMRKIMPPDRVFRIMLDTWKGKPELQECTIPSICDSLMRATKLGLDVDPALGHAYLVPFRNKATGQRDAQLIVGYKGYIELAIRSNKISGVPDGECVYEGDEFDYCKGTENYLRHRRGGEESDDKIICAWAMVRFPGAAEPRFHVASRGQIEKARAQSKAKDSGPWVSHYSDMALKTAYRRLLTKLSLTPELQLLGVGSDGDEGDAIQEATGAMLIEGTARPAIENSSDKQNGQIERAKQIEQEIETAAAQGDATASTATTATTATTTAPSTPAGEPGDLVNDEQYALLIDLLRDHEIKSAEFAKAMGIKAVNKLPAARFEEGCTWVKGQRQSGSEED